MNLNLEKLLNKFTSGQILAFSGLDGETDYDKGICATTSRSCIGIDIQLPGKCIIDFGIDAFESSLLGPDFLSLSCNGKKIRAAFCDAHNLLIEGECKVSSKGDDIVVFNSTNKTLVCSKFGSNITYLEEDFDGLFNMRIKWMRDQLAGFDQINYIYSAFAKSVSILKTQIYSPQGQIKHYWSTPDRWPHKGMWLWDSAFHSIGWRHLDIEVAKQILTAVLDVQKPDGMIPHMATPLTSTQITQPPVLCMAVDKIYKKQPDKKWLGSIYNALCAYIEWDFENRDRDGSGLLEWFIDNDPNCRSGESGMDNSPRFDSAQLIDAVDFNSFIALEFETLAKFAGILGYKDHQHKWQNKYLDICGKINERLWNEGQGFYFDYLCGSDKQSDVMAGAGFLPLICGAASFEQAKILAAHIRNPRTFGVSLPVATIAVNDEKNYSKDMWRGPVWVNLNWLVIKGFERYGLNDTADYIRNRTLTEIEKQYNNYGVIFEFYDDRREVDPPNLLRKGRCDPQVWVHQVIYDYGWTAALYIDMVLDKHTGEYGSAL